MTVVGECQNTEDIGNATVQASFNYAPNPDGSMAFESMDLRSLQGPDVTNSPNFCSNYTFVATSTDGRRDVDLLLDDIIYNTWGLGLV